MLFHSSKNGVCAIMRPRPLRGIYLGVIMKYTPIIFIFLTLPVIAVQSQEQILPSHYIAYTETDISVERAFYLCKLEAQKIGSQYGAADKSLLGLTGAINAAHYGNIAFNNCMGGLGYKYMDGSSTASSKNVLEDGDGYVDYGRPVPSKKVLNNGSGSAIQLLSIAEPNSLQEEKDENVVDTAGKSVIQHRLNIVVKNLDARTKEMLNLDAHGILIEGVLAGPARDAKLYEGDVIIMVNKQNIWDVRQLDEMVNTVPKRENLSFLIQRDGKPMTLFVSIY